MTCLHQNVRVSVFSMHALYLPKRGFVYSILVESERHHILPIARSSKYKLNQYNAGFVLMHT